MKLGLTALAGTAALSLGGCATVVNGVHQDLTFASDPEGAVVALSTGQSCTTPCEYSLRRGHDLRVDFRKDGYKPEFVYVQSRLAGSTFGNIILGFLLGTAVATIISFFYGSSKSSKDKTDTMSKELLK
jgi:hypothetical protein